jgi:hypothetical protein
VPTNVSTALRKFAKLTQTFSKKVHQNLIKKSKKNSVSDALKNVLVKKR